MSVINFTVTKPLETRIKQAIKERGFTSKAEFFRFAALQLIERPIFSQSIPDDVYNRSLGKLGKAIKKKYRGKKLPSLEDQLSDLR